jgi:carbon starvation protein
MYTKKQPIAYTLVPMIIILVFTLWAMVENLAGFTEEGQALLVILSLLIIVLALWLVVSALRIMLKSSLSALWKSR